MSTVEFRTYDAQEARVGAGEEMQRVRGRGQFLQEKDRALLEMAWRGSMQHSEAARLLEITVSGVSRRLERIGRRLHDPLVIALIEHPRGLPQELRQVGIEYFLQGRRVRELAGMHGVSTWEVRKMIQYIRGWFKGVQAGEMGRERLEDGG